MFTECAQSASPPVVGSSGARPLTGHVERLPLLARIPPLSHTCQLPEKPPAIYPGRLCRQPAPNLSMQCTRAMSSSKALTTSWASSNRMTPPQLPFPAKVGLSLPLPACHSRSTCCTPSAASAAAMAADVSPSVVLTREKGKNEKLRKALEQLGITCLELPLIESAPGPDLPQLQLLLRESAASLAWVAITSPEAAAVFLESWRAAGCPAVTLAVVGGGTAEAFASLEPDEQQRLVIGFTPSKATAKTLAAEIPGPRDGLNRVLYPASLKASTDLETGLQERGFHVTRLNTYSTETVTSVDSEILRRAAAAPVATFGSPTAVRAWKDLVVPLGWDGAAACIGETSAVAARKAGLQRVYHPPKPGIEGWVLSVQEALSVTTSLV